jgi:hypothetical protein
MRKILCGVAAAFALTCLMPVPAVLAEEAAVGKVGNMWEVVNVHRLGLGVNYWKTIDDIGDEVKSSGFSYLVSYQYVPFRYLKFEADVEVFPKIATGNDVAFAPELYVTAGGLFYVGTGIGIYYHDSYWSDAPFYMLRAGVDIPIAPRLFLDVNVRYRFNDWHSLDVSEDLRTDTIRFGALLRFTL